MKTKLFVGLGLIAMLVGGCVVPSLQPLFAERDYIYAPELVGIWIPKDESDKEVWVFAEDGRQYLLTHTDDKGHQATFHIAAGSIGTNVFLDFSPLDPRPGQELNSLLQAHLLPVHLFAKLVKTNDDLTLVAMNVEWLNDQLKANPKEIAHAHRTSDAPLLTGSTEEVKKFVTRHASDTNAFKNSIVLTAKKPAK